MRHKIILAMILPLCACKARQVDTNILKASSSSNVTSKEQVLQSRLDTGTVHQLTTNTKQTISDGKITIYPTPGRQFTYTNGTYTGTADSITESGTIKSFQQSKQDSNARFGTTAKTESDKALSQQTAQASSQKIKSIKATPIIPAGLLWILALVAAGFVLWQAWQRLKNII